MDDEKKFIGAGEVVDTEGLIRVGGALTEVTDKNDLLYAVVPEGYVLSVKDMARRNRDLADEDKVTSTGRPLRHVGEEKVADVESFIYMVGREVIPETTIVKASIENQSFRAVINYAENGYIAGHSDRKIVLSLAQTLEFRRWADRNRRRFEQRDLADFLEENIDSITEPDANEIINMISNLKVKRNREYHSVVDVESGNQSVVFTETVKGEVVNGAHEFLGRFKIAIPIFQGSGRYGINCRLRFGINENEAMVVTFTMLNLENAVEHAFNVENDKVRAAMTKLDVPVINIP